MATTDRNRTSRTGAKDRSTTTDWMKTARQRGLKLCIALMDDRGIVESVPLSFQRAEELGVNLRPIERKVIAEYSEKEGEERRSA